MAIVPLFHIVDAVRLIYSQSCGASLTNRLRADNCEAIQMKLGSVGASGGDNILFN